MTTLILKIHPRSRMIIFDRTGDRGYFSACQSLHYMCDHDAAGVPITYPRRAIRIPTGTSEPEYEPASTGADAVPPIFASDATAPVKRSIFRSLHSITMRSA